MLQSHAEALARCALPQSVSCPAPLLLLTLAFLVQQRVILCASVPPVLESVPQLLAKHSFYLHSFAEVERERPVLAGCGLSLYALDVNARLEFHASRTSKLAAATLEVFAPYGLVEESMYPCACVVASHDGLFADTTLPFKHQTARGCGTETGAGTSATSRWTRMGMGMRW